MILKFVLTFFDFYNSVHQLE